MAVGGMAVVGAAAEEGALVAAPLFVTVHVAARVPTTAVARRCGGSASRGAPAAGSLLSSGGGGSGGGCYRWLLCGRGVDSGFSVRVLISIGIFIICSLCGSLGLGFLRGFGLTARAAAAPPMPKEEGERRVSGGGVAGGGEAERVGVRVGKRRGGGGALDRRGTASHRHAVRHQHRPALHAGPATLTAASAGRARGGAAAAAAASAMGRPIAVAAAVAIGVRRCGALRDGGGTVGARGGTTPTAAVRAAKAAVSAALSGGGSAAGARSGGRAH